MKKLAMILGLTMLTGVANAQPQESSSDARRIFDEMRTKYAALETYSHTTTSQVEGKPAPSIGKFWFQQPNRFADTQKSTEQELLHVSDGKTNYFYDSRQNKTKYYAKPMPPLEMGRMGLMQYNAAGSLFTPFLAGINPFSTPWGEAPRNFSFGPPTTISGVAVDAIVVHLARDDNARMTYFIGQKDRLLYRITHEGGSGKFAFTNAETYSDIRLNPQIPISNFEFVPPPNTQHEDYDTAYHRAVGISENLKVGAAPPAVAGKNLQEHPINLDDFKGKVVLLDFWATWCGPCLVELPHIKAAYEKYSAQGFEVIGISFDHDRKALEKFVREKNLLWPQIPEGDMFKSKINKGYQLHTLPLSLLIGRDGRIAALNPRMLLLEPAIEKALRTPAPSKF